MSYLAGLLDGEGSFLMPLPSMPHQAGLALVMTDQDVVVQAAVLLEASWFELAPRQAHHKAAYSCKVRGNRALEVMDALKPILSARRQERIAAIRTACDRDIRRVPYATEIVDLRQAKRAGATRGELAVRYGVSPKYVDGLMRNARRPEPGVTQQASRIRESEERLRAAAGNSSDVAWAAGLLEGEGFFGPRTVAVRMTDKDPLERLISLFSGSLRSEPPRRLGWSPMWTWQVYGDQAIRAAYMVAPALGARRQGQIAAMRADAGRVPTARRERNIEIAARLAAGESGPELARAFGMTHQNVYYIAAKYGGSTPSAVSNGL